MAVNRSSNGMTPEQMSARRALIRALIKNQFSERPRNAWDGLNNLVGAISSRIAQDQLSKAETAEQPRPQTNLVSLVEVLKKRQIQGARSTTADTSKSGPESDTIR
jgi:hypothetical protein